MRLSHVELWIEGLAEYHKQVNGSETPFPIEYKRAKSKIHQDSVVASTDISPIFKSLVPSLEILVTYETFA